MENGIISKDGDCEIFCQGSVKVDMVLWWLVMHATTTKMELFPTHPPTRSPLSSYLLFTEWPPGEVVILFSRPRCSAYGYTTLYPADVRSLAANSRKIRSATLQ